MPNGFSSCAQAAKPLSSIDFELCRRRLFALSSALSPLWLTLDKNLSHWKHSTDHTEPRRDSHRLVAAGRQGMGIRDHKKTWRLLVSGSPQECATAFANAFGRTSGGPVLKRGRWDLHKQRGENGNLQLLAVYGGRAGLARVGELSRRSRVEEGRARGSTITFEITGRTNERTECVMWLSEASSHLVFFTADARFIRPYMKRVMGFIEGVDPTVEITSI